jgi:hypothetical protein
MSTLWEWYVFRDYGAGPSYAAWFGLSAIVGVMISPWLIGLANEPTKEVNPIAKVVFRSIGIWFGLSITLGLAWVVGFVLHWH